MPQTPDPLIAIERAVTAAGGKDKFLAYVAEHWPRLAGASVADVLEHTTSYDMFLHHTEPFYEAHADEMPPGAPNTAALHALIILGGEPTMGRLLRLLADAGLIPAPAVPALRWRVASAPSGAQPARTAIGWQAQGREFFYLTGAKISGAGYFLTRWRIGGASFLDDLTEACRNVADVDSDIHGRQLAELFEAGESLPEIGWFPVAASHPVPGQDQRS